jgi:hypothetical protein
VCSPRLRSSLVGACLTAALFVAGCTADPGTADAGTVDGGVADGEPTDQELTDGGRDAPDVGVDAFVLRPSALFGPCVEDSQCPGEGAFCRPASEGWPGGNCAIPCEDRTVCDDGAVYHDCVTEVGETQGYCQRRCLNGLDCGRPGYTCQVAGTCIAVCSSDEECGDETVCNRYSGRCSEAAVTGAVTGEPCGGPDDCASDQCREEDPVDGSWIGGACTAPCVLPAGYTTSSFFRGDRLPQGTCAGDAVCIPAGGTQAVGDLGTCLKQCEGDSDCRAGYVCLQEFALNSTTATYDNGICVPGECARAGCPSEYECVDGIRCERR